MALTVTVNKFASSNVQAVHRKQRKGPKKTTPTGTADFGRRGLLLSAAVATPQLSDSATELLKSTILTFIALLFSSGLASLCLNELPLYPFCFYFLDFYG